MAGVSAAVVVATFVIALSLFIAKFTASRKEVWRLQAANVPMPKFHPVFGHFIALKECIQVLPRNCTFHGVVFHLAKQFPGGIFYLNLWPFNRTMIVIATPFLASQVEAAFLHKPEEMCGPIDILTGGPSLMTMHEITWKRWRGLFANGFSASYMTSLAPMIADEVAVFCRVLRTRAQEGNMFQMEESTLRLTFDIIGHVTLDARLNYQNEDSPLAHSLRQLVYWTKFGTTFNPIRRYFSPRPFVQWYNGRRMNQYLGAEIDKRFEERDANSKPHSKSILSLAMDQYFANESDHGEVSRNTFKHIVMPHLRVFLYAGHDTTSSTLLYCYYMLSRHAKVLAKVRDEHDEIFGTDCSTEQVRQLIANEPQLLNKIPYTLAFIKEVLRLFPPAGSLREGRKDFTLVDEEGNRYPTEGCGIWTLMLILHHNPRVFARAEEFLPERWLVDPEDPLHPIKGSWRPFEWGQRNCIGQTLALLELKVVFVMTARMFDIKPAYEEWDQTYPSKGIKTIEGHRMYQVEMGGGGAHPADAFPCRVTVRL